MPPDQSATLIQYLVQFQEESATTWSNITISGNVHSAHLSALSPSTTYNVRVLAVNEVGSGPPSPSLMAATLQEGI